MHPWDGRNQMTHSDLVELLNFTTTANCHPGEHAQYAASSRTL